MGPNPERVLAKHPKFPHAVLVGMKKVPALEKLGNFINQWDLSRFVTVIDALGNKDPLKEIPAIQNLVKGWPKFRNHLSHEAFAPDADIFSDRELMVYIKDATDGLCKIRGLDESSVEAQINYRRLNQLENCFSSVYPPFSSDALSTKEESEGTSKQ